MSSMNILHDKRIDAYNVLIDMKVRDYLFIAEKILEKNIYQRKRVRSSSTVYSLLKDDLSKGCIIPPIVLGLTRLTLEQLNISDTSDPNQLIEKLKENCDSIVILDGLQRTYTLMDLEKELSSNNNSSDLDSYMKRTIRLELYIGVNKIGILYRMLTLNTGQTPMSLRHQIEILYSDLLQSDLEDITLVREVEESRARKLNSYSFRDVVEGFNSYIERNELPLDRADLLENIQALESLSLENQQRDLFKEFVLILHEFVLKVKELSENWEFDSESTQISGNPFARTATSIFTKSQAITGLGAAIGKLKEKQLISDIGEIRPIIADYQDDHSIQCGLDKMIVKLDRIKLDSKKIGNAQRMFFTYFFRELLYRESDSFLSFEEAVDGAFNKYYAQVF